MVHVQNPSGSDTILRIPYEFQNQFGYVNTTNDILDQCPQLQALIASNLGLLVFDAGTFWQKSREYQAIQLVFCGNSKIVSRYSEERKLHAS